MPVVSDPCSCQPDCLACGRGEVPPHDCGIHVLLESMTGGRWSTTRSFQSKTICQKIQQPRHSRQRCVANPQTVSNNDAKFETGDSRCRLYHFECRIIVVGHKFCHQSQWGLRAEARSSVEHAGRYSLPERIPTPPAQRPAEPVKMPPAEPERPALQMVDPSVSVNTVEVTPPLITRCDKRTQKISPTFMSNTWISERGACLKPFELTVLERICDMIIIDLLIQVLPDHEPHDVPWFEPYSYFEPADLDSDYMEQ
ncbi:hypothetical protein TNCV_768201 [Trichonephila clavipes]|nr:hypothetical protein TNCV_768201 [Trichonephila clavipes]